MQKKNRPDQNEEPQHQAAREPGADKSGEKFEQALGKIEPPKKSHENK